MEKVKLIGNLKGSRGFEMDLDGHKLITDAPVASGGENQGPSPKQLLLAGLIGCMGIDVTMILEKKKIEIEDLQIIAEADNNTDVLPKVYENIHLIFQFKGRNLDKETLQGVVDLSEEKYCGVSAMLKKHTSITNEVVVL